MERSPQCSQTSCPLHSTHHNTSHANTTRLGRDALLNVSFEADWQYIKERKQHRILQNNKKDNAKRNDHTYHPGDEVMVREDPHRKLEGARFSGPYTVTQVNDNGTVQLSKATRRGAVLQTWNIHNVKPC